MEFASKDEGERSGTLCGKNIPGGFRLPSSGFTRALALLSFVPFGTLGTEVLSTTTSRS